jgi:nucleoside-diphosphate-sugar epimerase
MHVLVTGHLGYLGSVLVPMLLENGHSVVGLDSNLYAACAFGDRIPTVPVRQLDIRDVEVSDLGGLDAIVHPGRASNDPLGDLNPALTHEINHAASVRLAKLAKAAGVRRFVFSSSCSNYGAAGDGLVDENAELRPITPYALSKVQVERDVALLADEDFSPVFLRNATAYGVSPRLRCDLVLNDLVAWAYMTGRVRLKSDGTPWRRSCTPRTSHDLRGRAVRASRGRSWPGVQRRADGRELPHQGPRRDRPGDGARFSHRVRAGRRPRSTELPGRLRQHPTGPSRFHTALDGARRRARAL